MSNKVHPIFQPILDAIAPPLPDKRGHEYPHEDSPGCWCQPTVDYRDPETGVTHYIHHEPN